jgi:hypothetical protein
MQNSRDRKATLPIESDDEAAGEHVDMDMETTERLRSLYADLISSPIPEKFQRLLDKARNKMRDL